MQSALPLPLQLHCEIHGGCESCSGLAVLLETSKRTSRANKLARPRKSRTRLGLLTLAVDNIGRGCCPTDNSRYQNEPAPARFCIFWIVTALLQPVCRIDS